MGPRPSPVSPANNPGPCACGGCGTRPPAPTPEAAAGAGGASGGGPGGGCGIWWCIAVIGGGGGGACIATELRFTAMVMALFAVTVKAKWPFWLASFSSWMQLDAVMPERLVSLMATIMSPTCRSASVAAGECGAMFTMQTPSEPARILPQFSTRNPIGPPCVSTRRFLEPVARGGGDDLAEAGESKVALAERAAGTGSWTIGAATGVWGAEESSEHSESLPNPPNDSCISCISIGLRRLLSWLAP